MQIYAFGSICRGEINFDSDIDLLAIVEGRDSQFDPEFFSIYSRKRIAELWEKGNPFAWHLTIESVILFSSDGTNYLKELGEPGSYKDMIEDCQKFYAIFKDASARLQNSRDSAVFELSIVFLAIRNIATCYSLGTSEQPDFSRNSALQIHDIPLQINEKIYEVLSRSRTLSTRGKGNIPTPEDVNHAIKILPKIEEWMSNLIKEAEKHV